MTQEFTDIMVDVESTGLNFTRNAIIQIAAVKFNYKTGAICHDMFDMCLDIPQHRAWSEQTRNWWMNQRQDILIDILQRAEPWKIVTEAFARWCYPAGSLRFWSKPSHFDFMFLSEYFNDAEVPNPFSYREANDMNSYLRGLYFPDEKPDERSFGVVEGGAHNALNDVLHQIKILFKAKEQVEARDSVQIIMPDNLKVVSSHTTYENIPTPNMTEV